MFSLSRQTHPQRGEVPEPAARVPGPPRTASPAAPPASAAARSSPGCGGRTPASVQSGLSGHVQPERGTGKRRLFHLLKGSMQDQSLATRNVLVFLIYTAIKIKAF